MDEHITKAQQTVALLESDVMQAFKEISGLPIPPQGRSRRDNALRRCLSECLTMTRQLQERLLDLGE